jgi:hypothetical protein
MRIKNQLINYEASPMNTIKKLSLIALMLSTAHVQTIEVTYLPDGFPNNQEGYEQKKAYEKNLSKRLITVGAATAATVFAVSMAFRPFIPGLLASNKIANFTVSESLKTVYGCANLALGCGITSLIAPLAEAGYRADESPTLPLAAFSAACFASAIPLTLLVSPKKIWGSVGAVYAVLGGVIAYENKEKIKNAMRRPSRNAKA